MVVVEVRQGPLDRDHWKTRRRKEERREGEGEGRRRKEKEATNIKSNNPHLAGGEKKHKKQCFHN